MDFKKIDENREFLVDAYVSDLARGHINPGLGLNEATALQVVINYERENGREPVGTGFTYAASRMLDNAFGADDGVHEDATFMISDLATQRFAKRVMDAAEAYRTDGKEPEGFDEAVVKYVIKEDLQSDPDIKSDWIAIAEGRFHDASPMMDDFFEHDIRRLEHLPEGAQDRIYELAEVELKADRDAEREAEADEALRFGLQQQLMTDPSFAELDDDEHRKAVDKWVDEARQEAGLSPLSRPGEASTKGVGEMFSNITSEMLNAASLDIQDADQRIRYNDSTIAVSSALERSLRYLDQADMRIGQSSMDQVEYGWAVNAKMAGDFADVNDEARTVLYVVATQREAEGMLLAADGRERGAERLIGPARALLGEMGMRTLEQENPPREDLDKIAAGRWDKVSEGHRAGLDLGVQWARENDHARAIDAKLDKLVLDALPSPMKESFASDLAARSAQPETLGSILEQALAERDRKLTSDLKIDPPVRSKGPQSLGDALSAALARNASSRDGR